MAKLSETITDYCPIDGRVCTSGTQELRNYASDLEKLLENNSPIGFSNGGIDWCPGDCGARKCKEANLLICRKLGLDPKSLLDKKGIPLEYSRQR